MARTPSVLIPLRLDCDYNTSGSMQGVIERFSTASVNQREAAAKISQRRKNSKPRTTKIPDLFKI